MIFLFIYLPECHTEVTRAVPHAGVIGQQKRRDAWLASPSRACLTSALACRVTVTRSHPFPRKSSRVEFVYTRAVETHIQHGLEGAGQQAISRGCAVGVHGR